MRRALLLIAIAAVSTAAQTPRKPPRFEDYRVPTPLAARAKPAEVANHSHDFKKEIVEAAKEGPDFAGHFVVEAGWTCGSACTYFAVVDVKTLKVYHPRFVVSYFCPEPEFPELEYHLNSNLLVVNGRIETYNSKGDVHDTPCGKYYYIWDGHELKQIYSVLAPKSVP
jgi:hypothetical protein